MIDENGASYVDTTYGKAMFVLILINEMLGEQITTYTCRFYLWLMEQARHHHLAEAPSVIGKITQLKNLITLVNAKLDWYIIKKFLNIFFSIL